MEYTYRVRPYDDAHIVLRDNDENEITEVLTDDGKWEQVAPYAVETGLTRRMAQARLVG